MLEIEYTPRPHGHAAKGEMAVAGDSNPDSSPPL